VATKASWSDTLTQERSVIPEFDLLSPKDVPFLKRISGGDEENPSLNSLDAACEMTKFEWIEDSDVALSSTLGGAVADGSTTSWTIAAGMSDLIQPGAILQCESEQVRVTAVSGQTLTVTRGWGGTTGAAHADATAVEIVGTVHKEGDDAPTAVYSYPTMPYNYTQELVDTILLTEIEQAVKRYGITNAVEYETAKKMRRLAILMEKQVFKGKRVQPTSTVPGAFGGLKTFIPAGNIVDASSAALTTTMILNAMQKVYDNVGNAGLPDTIVCNSWARRKLTTLFATTNVTTFRQQEDRRGGIKVDRIMTDFGELDILMTQWCEPSDVFLLQIDKVGIGPLATKPFTRQMLAKTGTADKWMVSGSYTLQVRASAYHALVKAISTTT
jgi:hypothetical protein